MNNYFLLSLIIYYIYTFVKLKKSYHILQQNWYDDGKRYINWINSNKEKVFFNFDFLIYSNN